MSGYHFENNPHTSSLFPSLFLFPILSLELQSLELPVECDYGPMYFMILLRFESIIPDFWSLSCTVAIHHRSQWNKGVIS